MRKRPVMDFTFLDKCFLAIEPKTWKQVNELLGRYGVAQKAVSTNVIRTDTTVVESNIHYPTDASLLWDTWRVASRLLKRAREIDPASCPHRFHNRKVKRLYLYVTRYMPSKSESRQRKVKAGVPHADRADGLDRGDCRGILWPRPPSQGNAALTAVALGTEGLPARDGDGRRHRSASPDRGRDGSGLASGCSAFSSNTRN